MNNIILHYSKINPNKLSVSFTWDDNFTRHIEFIAPKFEKYNLRCTFYINPGEPDFPARLYEGYAKLAKDNFELGSHGYTHHHFTKLGDLNYIDQLVQSKKAIEILTGNTPFTFAFPHHDFTADMLNVARKIYLETRNTLNNTYRVSLKSNTNISNVVKEIDSAILNRHSLVFSGHSVSLPTDLDSCDGYEPISLSFLDSILQYVLDKSTIVDILTFGQAVLKEYIINNCVFSNENFELTSSQIFYLNKYGITIDRIKSQV